MTPATYPQPHLWVPYQGGPGFEEICSLCGVFSATAKADQPCPETFPDMPEPAEISPPPEAPELPEGWDDEQRQGVIDP